MSGIKDRIAAGQDILGIKLMGPDGEVKDHKLVSDEGEVTLTNEFMITREFTSSNDFSSWIETHHNETGIPRMDLIIEYCHSRDIDIEAVAPLINKVLKERIRLEAEQAHLMKPRGRLPL
jgi:hypothetical protein